MNTPRLPVEYVLPLRRSDGKGLDELTAYLTWLAGLLDVTVVDGSPPERWALHERRFGAAVRHLRPDRDLSWANGKVDGVTTGVRLARHEHVVIADDDVRYDAPALRAVHRLLDDADLVRPQNYFAPSPWHARWDTARTLLARCGGTDFPGTLAVRRSAFVAMGGYDGDVLFENLELVRTVRAHGGVELRPAWLYVRRLPPDTRRFWNQRVRQAYDEFARPARMAAALAVVPTSIAVAVAGRRAVLGLAAATAVAAAEAGRRRAGGTTVFPATASLMAPVWIAERGACAWAAVGVRLLRGGVRYADRRIRTAAHSQRTLRRRARRAGRSPARPPAKGETATITPYPDGPLLVRGDFVLRASDGATIDAHRRTVALCRCGASARKPFCDGSHKAAGFHAPSTGG